MWQSAVLILMGMGVLALIGWSVHAFFMDSEISLLTKIAVGATGVSILILIGAAIKDRRAKARTEDFNEAER